MPLPPPRFCHYRHIFIDPAIVRHRFFAITGFSLAIIAASSIILLFRWLRLIRDIIFIPLPLLLPLLRHWYVLAYAFLRQYYYWCLLAVHFTIFAFAISCHAGWFSLLPLWYWLMPLLLCRHASAILLIRHYYYFALIFSLLLLLLPLFRYWLLLEAWLPYCRCIIVDTPFYFIITATFSATIWLLLLVICPRVFSSAIYVIAAFHAAVAGYCHFSAWMCQPLPLSLILRHWCYAAIITWFIFAMPLFSCLPLLHIYYYCCIFIIRHYCYYYILLVVIITPLLLLILPCCHIAPSCHCPLLFIIARCCWCHYIIRSAIIDIPHTLLAACFHIFIAAAVLIYAIVRLRRRDIDFQRLRCDVGWYYCCCCSFRCWLILSPYIVDCW